MIGYSLFQLKATSANGRLFMWKISTLAIAESPLIGHGTGNFVSGFMAGHRRVILQTKSIRKRKNWWRVVRNVLLMNIFK